ncbi:hypothetical protein PV10_07492 [Exophiala mesophila]|uniref:FAD/NAD(P)-binding domain-containing protein n=1 Tax=Exophiala mesophila TaxID=212818 RepID=A0A0D1ZTN6_EXOME|nr:uncharacterized protein PV10_07492 [Exophiala mesophila]KIV90158.1 hypothetical protein PV10_07492 [Exophiala mesophila]
MASRAAEYFRSTVDTTATATPSPANCTQAYRGKDELAYLLSQKPLGTPRRVKVIVLGAGFSGLSFAHEVQTGSLPNVDLQIFEKNAGVGGTWFENRYPGCACDIPIHNYQWSWAPYPYFDRYYATGPEIRGYIEAVADQHDLRQYVKTSHMVTGATWDEVRQVWQVQVQKTNGKELIRSKCDFLLNASGFVNDWKWPDIVDFEAFQGKVVHTAAWDDDIDLVGKKVAIIGNGSSGVQVLPAIKDKVAAVSMYMRNPTWITPNFALNTAPKTKDHAFSEEEKKHWAENPDDYLAYRKAVEAEINSHFPVYIRDSAQQAKAKETAITGLWSKLGGKPELAKLLQPQFAVGCRRLTPGNGFLETLASDTCEVVWGEIERFTRQGIKSADEKGTIRGFDVIICATGFDISFTPRFPVLGLQGQNLQDMWKEKRPEAYLSIAAESMPNYFTYLGPSCPIAHGSLVTIVEMVTKYIAELIRKAQTENYSSVVVKPGIPAAYMKHALAWLDKSSWNSGCISTYKNGKQDGELVSLHPGSRLHFFRLLQTRRYEDYSWKSFCDDPDLRFAWLGNGYALEETLSDKQRDPTYWLKPVAKECHIRRVSSQTTALGDGPHKAAYTNGEPVIGNGHLDKNGVQER